MSDWQHAAARIRDFTGAQPYRLGLVLGSGLGEIADGITRATRIDYSDLPGFPCAAVSGHAGHLVTGELAGVRVACLSGRAHVYEGHGGPAIATPIRTLRALGCEAVLLTNAAGGLHEHLSPGAMMLIADHINWSGFNPLTGANDAALGPRFFDMSNAYDADLRQSMLDAAGREGITLHSGVYAFFPGPSFETPAEVRAAGILGADAVGMSTVPETLVAVHCGLKVAAISCITNHAAGIAAAPLNHSDTLAQGASVAGRLARLIERFVRDFAAHD